MNEKICLLDALGVSASGYDYSFCCVVIFNVFNND